MQVIRKDGEVTVTMSNLEAAILHMALDYSKGTYFQELDHSQQRGPSIIHPDLVKATYREFLEQLKA